MADERLILTLERLRDDLNSLGGELRRRYGRRTAQVRAEDVRRRFHQLAEVWLTDAAPHSDVIASVESGYLADLNVSFQRLLRYSEHATQRSRYEDEVRDVLRDFTLQVIVPLKQRRGQTPVQASQPMEDSFAPTAFLAHSFDENDASVVDCIRNTLTELGISVVTGERPRSESISEKIKQRIEDQHFFVGAFTRRDKISGRNEWVTSPWLIDEKAYAVGLGKKLVLLREEGVGSVGGLQGDWELIAFSRTRLDRLSIALIQVLDVSAVGFR